MFDGTLIMSFHTLNYQFHNLGFANTHRILYKKKLNPVLAVPSFPIHLQADEGGKFPESNKKGCGSNLASTSIGSSNSLLVQSNSVGIIGGMSVNSTLNFLRKLVHLNSKDGSSIPFVLCSDPELSKGLSLHERSSPSLLSSKNECSELDPSPIVENLRSKRIFLEKSGARCIVMPCHISHSWFDEVSEGCSVPFLHIGECIARHLKEAKLKPLEAGSPLRIGVLGTSATLTAGFYQEKLQNEGFEVVVPDKATMEHTVIPAIEAINRKDIEGAQNLLRIALQVLLVRAVNSIILASGDMRDLFPQDDPLLKKCIDPMDALAYSAVKWAQSARIGM